MKEKFRRLMSYIATITTGTLIACMIWGSISIYLQGIPWSEAIINFSILPEILSVGVFCGVVTELVCYFGRDAEKLPFWVWNLLLYIAVTIVVLVCGYLYHWYKLSIGHVIAMCLTSAGVYCFTFFLNYYHNKIIADAMNKKLEQYHSKRKKKGESQ